MAARIVAHPAFDYRAATGFLGLLFFIATLVPPFGSAANSRLGVMGIALACVVLYKPLCHQIRFREDRIEYGNLFGWVSRSWPLDGTSRITFDHDDAVSRWGLKVHGTLALKGKSGYDVALTTGRYTNQRVWSQFLLDQQISGTIRITEEARERLTKHLVSS